VDRIWTADRKELALKNYEILDYPLPFSHYRSMIRVVYEGKEYVEATTHFLGKKKIYRRKNGSVDFVRKCYCGFNDCKKRVIEYFLTVIRYCIDNPPPKEFGG
jgi:hypothetical protein